MTNLNGQIADVPAYPGGIPSGQLFEVGCGVKLTPEQNSIMQVISETGPEDFRAYTALLEQAGFTCCFSREDAFGLYAEYRREERLLYLCHLIRTGETRIIDDVSSASLEEFCADDTQEVRPDTELMQFGLAYSEMRKGQTCDCGMNYAIRLRNNELILVDGGEIEQATPAALGEFMRCLRMLTRTVEGEKITVACWYCSHFHNDHMDFFEQFLRRYRGVVTVKRFLFNFPSESVTGMTYNTPPTLAYLNAVCPDVCFLKPHTGMVLHLGNAELQVLLTHEDLLPAFWRDGRWTTGHNSTSTVLNIRVDGVSLLLLGDAEDANQEIYRRVYGDEPIEVDCVQAAHHLINLVPRLYEVIRAKHVWVPGDRYNVDSTRRYQYQLISDLYGHENITLAGDYTTMLSVRNGRIQWRKIYPVVSEPYCPGK